jgi:DNA-binding NarL/FixJ family response regulator
MSAVLAGAAGYVLKNVRGTTIVEDVRKVAAGRSLIDRSIATRVSKQATSDEHDDPRFSALNLRERQVLALIADGLTNRQIGEHLGLAEKTVKNYVSGLLSKLGFERRTQAAIYQMERRAHGDA